MLTVNHFSIDSRSKRQEFSMTLGPNKPSKYSRFLFQKWHLHLSLCLRGFPPNAAGALTTEENSSLPHLNVIRIISLASSHLQFTPTETSKTSLAPPQKRKSIISQPSIFRCERVMLVSGRKRGKLPESRRS